ncbi:helix-turn-helix domain-containing protein [Nocardia iowensis]|uniref:Helix-turn-helix domain-containing protein n=1 Tax=Nocardia iowensis TaxID=204891 RepID=A0ABX8RLZ2_NOCIO|nr:helix-turn-helix domain-containing protein [Nocardia iowensis]QXN90326.1 helix-turn-helix domain-containing protein [Nocardia iowensis]
MRNDSDDRARWPGLGAVVHDRRRAARLTLATLAAKTELSQSFLSQLENGRTNTSLRSLQRIADALDTTATELLAAADSTPGAVVVRADEGRLDQADPNTDGSVRSLVHGSRDLRALEFIGGTERGEREFTHPNDELIYVVTGTITVVANGEEVTLSTGDSYYCPSGVRHRWWAHADDTTTLVLAVADGRTVRRAPHRPRRT